MPTRRSAILLMSAARLWAADYRLAPEAGIYLRLIVEKTGLLRGKKHVFEFSRYRGAVAFDPASPLTSDVRFTVEAASIRCLDEWVSEKDRGKIQREAEYAMLAVDRFPEIVFRSTDIAKEAGGKFRVQGLLTIRNVAKPVNMDVVLKPESGKAVWAEGEAVVRLTDYGLKPPSTALGAIGTKDEMTVSFRMKLNLPEGRGKDESPQAAFAVPEFSAPPESPNRVCGAGRPSISRRKPGASSAWTIPDLSATAFTMPVDSAIVHAASSLSNAIPYHSRPAAETELLVFAGGGNAGLLNDTWGED